MLVPRNQRQAAAFGLAATLAPAVGPLVKQAGRAAYEYMTQPAPKKGVVQRIIRDSHEPKNVDTTLTTALTGTGVATYALLNAIDQGTGGTQRTGRQVMLSHIEMRATYVTDPSNLTGDSVRHIVFMDRETRGGTPSTGDLLSSVASGYAAVVSPYDFDNVPSRFTILLDETISLNPVASPTTTTTTAFRYDLVRRIKLNKRQHFYNTTGGAVADIDSGSIFIFVVGQNTTHETTINATFRVVFRDL